MHHISHVNFLQLRLPKQRLGRRMENRVYGGPQLGSYQEPGPGLRVRVLCCAAVFLTCLLTPYDALMLQSMQITHDEKKKCDGTTPQWNKCAIKWPHSDRTPTKSHKRKSRRNVAPVVVKKARMHVLNMATQVRSGSKEAVRFMTIRREMISRLKAAHAFPP